MNDSILTSMKLALNVVEAETNFDFVITMHINSVFSDLNQLGVGPASGFSIQDAAVTWDAFTNDDDLLNNVKSYMYLRVKLLFDPSQLSFLNDATQKQIDEFVWRISIKREGESWVDPIPPVVPMPRWWC